MSTKAAIPALRVLFFGATGETGRQALLSCLSSPSISTIVALGRRAPSLPADTPHLAKLTSAEIDFDLLLKDDADEVRKVREVEADAVIITLGTNWARAGTLERYILYDREYVLAAAKAARVEGKEQKVLYVSAFGVSSTSWFALPKSKGLTEEGLASLGYAETIIFRPGLLAVPGGRAEALALERVTAKITGLLAHATPRIQISTPILGAAIVRAAVDGAEALQARGLARLQVIGGLPAWMVGNKEAGELGVEI